MNNFKIWSPLSKVEPQKYLYHYTDISKAMKILYYETLQFSPITNTNDIFEQKPKLLFEENIYDDSELLKAEKRIENYFQENRKRIKILCFSQDNQKDSANSLLTKDMQLANVIGRGFALPRMWAQYADDNEGICLIINKEKLISKLQNEGFIFTSKKVDYSPSYSAFKINAQEITKLSKKIDNNTTDVIADLIRTNSKYVRYNYFYKLKDWSTENEFRILILTNGDDDKSVKIPKIFDFIEGIVIGNNTNEENSYIIKKIVSEKCPKLSVRRIVFDSMITTIQDI
jgi:hypothetical protein